jgi:hypothetical protein
MSRIIEITAEAEGPESGEGAGFPRRTRHLEEKPSADRLPVQQFPAHQFPASQFAAKAAPMPEATEALAIKHGAPTPFSLPAEDVGSGGSIGFDGEVEEDRERARRTYRGRTVAMLRRYMRYSIETGRLPSLLGREFFRAKVTSYTVVTFEDRVIFVHDMEKCLARLDEFSRQLIARHILQEHDRWATAKLLHCNEKTVRRYTPLVLDVLSEILIEVGLMERLEPVRRNSCQEGESDPNDVSDCDDGKYKV